MCVYMCYKHVPPLPCGPRTLVPRVAVLVSSPMTFPSPRQPVAPPYVRVHVLQTCSPAPPCSGDSCPTCSSARIVPHDLPLTPPTRGAPICACTCATNMF